MNDVGESMVRETEQPVGSLLSKGTQVDERTGDGHIDVDPKLHNSWRVALYYCYIDLSDVPEHVEFHRQLCESLSLNGRIRVSAEGLNGVLTGLVCNLQEYEQKVMAKLHEARPPNGQAEMIDLDVKYCFLRKDLPIEPQLFDKLICKKTSSVISLFDNSSAGAASDGSAKQKGNRRSKQSNRRQRRKQQRQEKKMESIANEMTEEQSGLAAELPLVQSEMMKLSPSEHLSADEWNEKLGRARHENALLLDVRNVYESRVGHFSTTNVPTLLTNTRKYSDLPELLAENPNMKNKDEVFMYCTGGVRCERVSMLVQAMYPQTKVYQLKGGIQTYLRESENEQDCLFKGKNFVFDPRRTDPVHFGDTVGRCLICETPHDDYDNGYAPSECKEARCNTCRMLVLICNRCRPKYLCWGETDGEDGLAETVKESSENMPHDPRPRLYCAIDRCIHEGAKPHPELLKNEMK